MRNMKPRIKILLLSIIPFIGFGCVDEDDPNLIYDSQILLECHDEQSLDLEHIKEKVIGQWEWKHAEYIYAIPPDNDLEGMRINIKDNFSGTITYMKEAPLEFTWSIGAYTYFGFSTDPIIPQLNGRIIFCDNIMLCGIAGTGIVDGVNNYYKRVNISN
jgi:hypothetical protein